MSLTIGTAVRKAKRVNPFDVTIMQREDFFSFKFLEKNVTKKKFTGNKEKKFIQ